MCRISFQVLQANVMKHDPDSENVNRLWSDRPQPSGDANNKRCSWCFTQLMNLHDFVTESFNPEHIFRDARTVSFCLTTDHISTCHDVLCTLQDSTVLVCSGYVVNGSVVSVFISDVGISGTETCHLPRSFMESACGNLATSMECYGEVGVETCQHSWSAMQSWCVWTFSWSTMRSR